VLSSEISLVIREITRRLMTPKEREKIKKPGPSQWEKMEKKITKKTLVYLQRAKFPLYPIFLGLKTTLFRLSYFCIYILQP
jgi:hypothetical protein